MTINSDVKSRVIAFAARFGFVTRDIFFTYLCDLGHSQKYRTWRFLIEQRWLIAHDETRLSAYLSAKSRKDHKGGAVPARSHFFIEHDSISARLMLEVERLGMLARYWTDRELISLQWEAFQILGSSSMDKVPDLVLELKGAQGPVRIAVEIERTQKSKERYMTAAFSYLAMQNIDLVVYGCRTKKAATLVRAAFRGELFRKSFKSPAIFDLNSFATKGMATPVEFLDRKFELLEFLRRATKTDGSAYGEHTAVCSKTIEKKEVA